MNFLEFYFWVYIANPWYLTLGIACNVFFVYAFWHSYFINRYKYFGLDAFLKHKYKILFSFVCSVFFVQVIIFATAKRTMYIYESVNNKDCSNNYVACYAEIYNKWQKETEKEK
jgi:hypothetical protein